MNKQKNDIFDINLDEEEQEISHLLDQAIEKDQLKSVDNLAEEFLVANIAARNYFHKKAKISISISEMDLAHLKQKAAFKGLPYQAFIASVLHEYVAGHFDGK